MLELYLQGYKPGEIASELGVDRVGVTWVIGSAPFQHELALRRKDRNAAHDNVLVSTVVNAQAKLANAAERAADKLIEQSDHQDPRLSAMAISQILDRAGVGVKAGQSGQQVNIQILSPERVQLLMQSIQESKSQNGEAA